MNSRKTATFLENLSERTYAFGHCIALLALCLAMTSAFSDEGGKALNNNATKAITVDGRLDEAAWKDAPKYSGFTVPESMRRSGNSVPNANTEFQILQQKDAIYIGVKCFETDMNKLASTPGVDLWGTDAIELFLVPDGSTQEYYQFLVTFTNYTYAMYYAEGGNIKPDPYGPIWKTAIHADKDFWSAEIELPLTAFYMTRQNIWKDEWRVNVCRCRTAVVGERSSWSPLKRAYRELHNFKTIKGFPMRPAQDYVYVSSAEADVTGQDNDKPKGNLEVKVQLDKGDDFVFFGKNVKLKKGLNTLSTPYVFEKSGRNQVRIDLKRASDGKDFGRFFPIIAIFTPIKVNFTLPEYRRNFYPGQDYSKVAGTVVRAGNAPVTVTLEGAGLAKKTLTLKGDKLSFEFDTSKMQEGEAFLTAKCGEYEIKEKIRRLKPYDKRTAWISGGNLIVDGKPVLRRNMYAEHYMGGEAFREKYDNDDLCQTLDIKGVGGWVEPARLVKGIESKEATRDVYPCQEYWTALDKTIEKAKKGNGVFYYISDEPECRNVSPVYLKHIYDYLCEKDPYHVVLIGSRACSRYLDCADWFETHPYINARESNGVRKYDREINTLGNYIDEISTLNRPDKCIGSMPTSFASRSSSRISRYPNFVEMVCHTWAFMIRGCKTLYPYAYHDLGDVPSVYEGIRYIFTSVDALQDFILFGKRTLLFHNTEAGAALFELKNGEKMFTAVNYSTQPVTVSLKGVKGNFVEFRGDRTFSKFDSMTLAPQEVIIGTTKKKGEKLKSFKEVAAEIDAKEKARCSTGNLLFGHENDVEITASRGTPRISYKMFDGTRDVLAFYDMWNKNKFYEISFPKYEFKPKFSKVRIYGFNLGTPTIKIRKRGKWVLLEPTKMWKDKYMVGFDYPESYETVKFHIDFHQNKLELYEIELLK